MRYKWDIDELEKQFRLKMKYLLTFHKDERPIKFILFPNIIHTKDSKEKSYRVYEVI